METGSKYLASIGQAVQGAYGPSPLTHAMSVRNAVGVVAAVVLAMIFVSPSAALVTGMGAITVALADRPGLDVTKAPRMLWTVIGAAIAVFAGTLLGGHTATEIAALGIAAFCVGVLSAYGAGPLQSGVASILTLLVAATQSHSFAGSLGYAGIVILAGVLQTILSLSASPAPARNPDGHALDRVFRDLAAYMRDPEDRGEVPASMAHSQAYAYQQALSVYAITASREQLLENLHRIQFEVIAFVDASQRFASVQPELYQRWTASRKVLAESLEGCGHLLVGTTSLSTVESSIAQARSQLTSMAGELVSTDPYQIGSWRKLARTLLAHLEGAAFAADSHREDRVGSMAPRALFGAMRDRARATIHFARLNVRARSPMFRHALRLMFAVVVASLAPVFLDVPHWYWSPMATLVVLRPFYANALQRMWESWLGFVVGLVAGTVVALVFGGSSWVMIGLIGLFIFLQRLYGAVNVGFGMTMVAASVVGLFSLVDLAVDDALIDRAVNVAIGGIVAVVVHVLWPTWQRLRTRDLMAECIDRYRDVFAVVVPNALGQSHSDFSVVMSRRAIARAARGSAEETLRRPGNDADTSNEQRQIMSDLLMHLRVVVWSTLRLEAYARMIPAEDSDHELVLAYQEFMRASERVMLDVSHSVTHGHEPGSYAASVSDAVSWMKDVVTNQDVENKESSVLAWYGVMVQADVHATHLQQIEDQVTQLAVMSGNDQQR